MSRDKLQPLYIVVRCKDNIVERPLVEPADEESNTAIFRAFCSYEESLIYCEQAQQWFEDERLEIRILTLRELFESIGDLCGWSLEEYDCPCKLYISSIEPEKWPEVLDVLWDPYETAN